MIDYSKKLYDTVRLADMNKLGVQLGAACIDARVPVQIVAKWVGVSRQGVYNWFTGLNEVAQKHQAKVVKITSTLLRALDDGKLPAEDLGTTLAIVQQYRKEAK